ncbi:MAG: tetratricopeptide repeat protein [Thermoanaerobaculia bacterium]
MSEPLARWKTLALVSAALVVASCPLHVAREAFRKPAPKGALEAEARFVGRARCTKCHEKETKAWAGSNHDLAMAEPTPETVRGDFGDGTNTVTFEGDGIRARFSRRGGKYFVETEGPDGKYAEYEVAYTFGWKPLQQLLVRFPGGRLQAVPVAWDTERKRWFFLYEGKRIPPGDWLHWTRNGQNWNGMCAQCHSTNLVKGYDAASDSYRTTWSEIDVSCEACHGPGSRHVAWAEVPPMGRAKTPNAGLVQKTSGITNRELVELCAPCHSRRSELGGWAHGGGALLDSHLPVLLDEGLYHPDGQILEEDYEYGSFLQSKMYRMGVRCTDCHDAHTGKRLKDGNALCTRCHAATTYDDAAHHFHKKEWQGKPSRGALCESCHMPTQNYMVVHARHDHSIRVPRPDLSKALGVPNACGNAGCHADKPLDWVVAKYDGWYGKARKPHYGTILAAARRGEPAAGEGLVRLAGDTLAPTLVRATALSLLGAYPGPDSDAALRRALVDEEALLRRTAVVTLRIGDPAERVARLGPLLADPIRAVRLDSAAALAGTPPDLLKPYQREALEKGIAEYEKAMEYSLDFASAAHNLGNLYARMGDAAKAEAAYRRALAVDDLFFPAKANLAVLLSRQGKNAEAEKLLREILAAYPANADAAYSLGLLVAEKGEFAEAASLLARAAAGMPGEARVHYNAGLALARAGRDAESEKALRRAVELEPASVDLLFALGDFQLRRGRFAEAQACAERILAAHPEDGNARALKSLAASRTLPPR